MVFCSSKFATYFGIQLVFYSCENFFPKHVCWNCISFDSRDFWINYFQNISLEIQESSGKHCLGNITCINLCWMRQGKQCKTLHRSYQLQHFFFFLGVGKFPAKHYIGQISCSISFARCGKALQNIMQVISQEIVCNDRYTW